MVAMEIWQQNINNAARSCAFNETRLKPVFYNRELKLKVELRAQTQV